MPHEWVTKINKSSDIEYKKDILQQALESTILGSEDSHIFLNCIRYSIYPNKEYNVSLNIINKAKIHNLTNRDNNYEVFFSLLNKLSNDSFNELAIRSLIEIAAYNFDSNVWEKLLKPVILKDMNIGITIDIFNDVMRHTKYEILH